MILVSRYSFHTLMEWRNFDNFGLFCLKIFVQVKAHPSDWIAFQELLSLVWSKNPNHNICCPPPKIQWPISKAQNPMANGNLNINNKTENPLRTTLVRSCWGPVWISRDSLRTHRALLRTRWGPGWPGLPDQNNNFHRWMAYLQCRSVSRLQW